MGKLLGEVLNYCRRQKGMSIEALADGVCSSRQIINIEKGSSNPSVDLLEELGKKLSINILSMYTNVSAFSSLPVYLKILEIDAALETYDLDKTLGLIEKYEEEEEFRKNKEAQTRIANIRAGILFSRGETDEALKIVEYHLKKCFSEFPRLDLIPYNISNTEYALLLLYGGIKMEYEEESKKADVFLLIEKRVKYLLFNLLYVSEEKRAFWLNLWCSCVYNLYFVDSMDDAFLLGKINEVLEYQKKNNRSHMLTQLLLCKASILNRTEKVSEAEQNYNSAIAIGNIYYSEKELKSLVERINKR